MAIEEVSIDGLDAALAAGARVFDVREPDEYVAGHVPGAVAVPLGEVAGQVDQFRGAGPAYVVCKSGGRSMRACELLADEGVAVVNVAGGTAAWVASGRDVVFGDRPA